MKIKDLVSFGNYLLGKYKISEEVTHADIENWKHDKIKEIEKDKYKLKYEASIKILQDMGIETCELKEILTERIQILELKKAGIKG